MRAILCATGLAVLLACALSQAQSKASAGSASGQGSMVVVFKDGHRQTIRLADVARIEFTPGAQMPVASTKPEAATPAGLPSHAHYVGRWEVGEGNSQNFYITLDENGDALRSLHSVHGHWTWINGEAQIVWDDGYKDAIRKVGGRFQKYAYDKSKSFTDEPDNVTSARNLSPRPI